MNPSRAPRRGAKSRPRVPGAEAVAEGIAAFNGGRFKEAAGHFERALAAGNADPATRSFLAHSYASDGDPERARRTPDSIELRLKLAEGLRASGDLREAEKQFREVLRRSPRRSEACLSLAGILASGGKDDEAEALFRKAATLDPSSVWPRLNLGDFLLSRGRASDSLAPLRRAVRLAPEMIEAKALLAAALAKLRRGPEAEAAYREALSLPGAGPELECDLAELCFHRGGLAEAERLLRAALAAGAAGPRPLTLLGRVVARRGDLEEAASLFEKAAALDPGSAEAGIRAAEILIRQGRFAEAEARLRRVIGLEGGAERGRLMLAEILKRQNRLEETVKCLEAPVLLESGDAVRLFELGWLRLAAGDRDGASGAFGRYLSMERDDGAAAWSRRLIAAVSIGDFAKAVRAGERFLDRWDESESYELVMSPWPESWNSDGKPEPLSRTLGALERWNGRSPWSALWRGQILLEAGRMREGLYLLDSLRARPPARYGWMRFAAGFARLRAGAYAAAEDEFRAALTFRPGAWWVRGRLAESLLCRGRTAKSFAEFSRASRSVAGKAAAAEVNSWRGEASLWLGRYDDALSRLDLAVRGGSRLGLCWKGAALLLTGRLEEAAADLERAVAADAKDAEALVWLGELERRAGRHEKALAVLDRAVERRGGTWAHVNRALARAAAGDERGMWEDFEAVRPSAAPLDPENAPVATLEAALRRARGIRRDEIYLDPVYNIE